MEAIRRTVVASWQYMAIGTIIKRALATALPPPLYHWLLTRTACRFVPSAQSLPSSVIFPYPFGDSGHYVLVTKRFIRSAFALSEAEAVAIEKDLRSWANQVYLPDGAYLPIIVNYGQHQETPFLHAHAIIENASHRPSRPAGLGPRPWFKDITGAGARHGRRIVHYCPGHDNDAVIDQRP